MESLPAELVKMVIRHLDARTALALSKTCKRMAMICKASVLDYTEINFTDTHDRRLFLELKENVRAVHTAIFLASRILPQTPTIRILNQCSIFGIGSEIMSPIYIEGVISLLGKAKHLILRKGKLMPIHGDFSLVDTTAFRSLETLVLQPSRQYMFSWPLSNWLGTTLKVLKLNAWNASAEQWKELFSKLGGVTELALDSTRLDLAAFKNIGTCCPNLVDLKLVNCDPLFQSLWFSDVLEFLVPCTQLRALHFDRTRSEIEEEAMISQLMVQQGATVLKRLEVLRINCITPGAKNWVRTNCNPIFVECLKN